MMGAEGPGTLRNLLAKWEIDVDEVLDTRVGGPGSTAGGPVVSATLEWGYGAAPPEITIRLPNAKIGPTNE